MGCPLNPVSPYPRSSTNNMTTFGGDDDDDAVTDSAKQLAVKVAADRAVARSFMMTR